MVGIIELIMGILKTTIKDVSITPLREIADDRGSVLHMLRCDADEFTQFGECYFSEVVPHAIKAWKKHTIQTEQINDKFSVLNGIDSFATLIR